MYDLYACVFIKHIPGNIGLSKMLAAMTLISVLYLINILNYSIVTDSQIEEVKSYKRKDVIFDTDNSKQNVALMVQFNIIA